MFMRNTTNRTLLSFLTLWVLIGILVSANAQNAQKGGYQIKVEIKNYPYDTLFLGFYYGDKQYLKDTATLEKGKFVFKKDEPLLPGNYLLLLRPDNQYVQININEGKQNLQIKFDANDPVKTIDFNGEKDNSAFYKYISYLGQQRKMADSLRATIDSPEIPESEKKRIENVLKDINEQVRVFQDKMEHENQGTLTAMMIAAYKEKKIPDFEDVPEGIARQRAQYQYFMDHYFDGIDLNDVRIVRTSFMFSKISDYIHKHTLQHPDSLNPALDRIFKMMEKNEDAYKFYLVHFLNHYAKSNIIGMDAIYVHLVDNYYLKGAAPWIDEEQLEKMRKNSEKLRPILIGKTAPNIRMQRQDESKIALHDIQSPYTVLVFWAPDCGHCQKVLPKLGDFYEKYHPRGVEVFSVCTKLTDKVPECWKMIEEKGIGKLINVVDPYHLSKFNSLYDVQTTPQIFILDDKKEILMKRISVEQLDEVMEEMMERRSKMADEFK